MMKISYNEICLSIKYIKSALWRVAKSLSYIEDAWCLKVNPPIYPTFVDIEIILNVKALISIRYDININGAVFCTVIDSAQFSHLNPSITPGNHQ